MKTMRAWKSRLKAVAEEPTPTRKCPDCAEKIPRAAKVCPLCRSPLGARTRRPQPRFVVAGPNWGQIVLGVLMLVVGLVVSVASFAVASSGSGSGRFTVMAGLIGVGALNIVRGLMGGRSSPAGGLPTTATSRRRGR